jgi:two-component system NtrC family sensor kinase
MSRGRVLAYQYWMPAAILILGAVSTGMVYWTYRISERQRVSYEHIENVLNIGIRTATVHVALDRAATTSRSNDLDTLLPDLDEAVELSQTLILGGFCDDGTPLPPLVAPDLREHVVRLAALLTEFKAIASKRAAHLQAGAIHAALTREFDAVSGQVQHTVRTLASVAEKSLEDDRAQTRRLLFGVVVIWSSVVLASTVGLHNRERRRRRAELALEAAYGEMERRVQARTSELAEANTQLQEEIAERRRTEDSLRQSEEKFRALSVQFRTLLETIPDRITLISRDLKVVWANRVAGLLSPASQQDGNCGELCDLGPVPCHGCPSITTFATGRAASARVSSLDGRHWDVRTIPIMGHDGAVENVLEVATDITENVRLQAETMRAAHLASIGEFAAGVAHEINNPINGIINFAQILCNRIGVSQEHDIATRILSEGNRIADIVRGLFTFARGGRQGKCPVSVKEILSASLALTRSQMHKEGISVQVALEPRLFPIVANAQQIQQVFMNVINNARYALNQKYPGTHEDKILEVGGELTRAGGVPWVRVTFYDRGVGIPPHLVNKVMEPFFSTKPSGEGAGLGLSVSHGIVADHHGRIAIESVEGEFTRVLIDLPAREGVNGDDPHRR